MGRDPEVTLDLDPELVINHSVELVGLAPCTGYVFEVSSASPDCYLAVDDNGGGSSSTA